ncbi:MAG TPA: SufD family Fe-S cluster assembly protein, partial [Pirellulaceae bacterium]|nr:SufD family Fe-S cluster assembly protein [Pirellulaceae bacterium]
MMETTTSLSFTADGFEAFVSNRDEPQWLVDLRTVAWKKYSELAWPARNDEEWIRTDIRQFKLDRYSLSLESPAETSATALLREGVELGGGCTSLDSQKSNSFISDKWSAKGVVFGSFDDIVRSHGDLIRPYLLRRAVNPNYDKFAALHAAFMTGGSILYVPRNVVVDEPFHGLSALTDGGTDFGHTLVILEDGAEATMLSETASENVAGGGLHCGAIELIVSPNAHLRYVNLQNWGSNVWHFAHQKAVVNRDASLQWTIAAMGAKLAKVNQHVGLIGEGANCQVN